MSNRSARHKAVLLAIFVAGVAFPLASQSITASSSSAGDTQWNKDLAAWRTQREQSLSAPDGWLTLIGLEWLKPGVNTVGSAAECQIRIHAKAPEHIGLLTVSANTLQILAPTGGFPPDLTIDSKPAREGLLAADDAKPNTIAWHGLTMVVLHRGNRYALRIKDADSPTRTGFHGLNWYPPDPHFRVAAHWIPYNPPHTEKIPTVIGTVLSLPSPGVAEFTLDGKTLRLEPVIEGDDQTILFFILRDQTSKTTTYEAARFLHTGLPDHGLTNPGRLELDFNKLENPPCAYTPYATCPLPPEQNRLPVSIPAGEQRYPD
ncbi:MAG: DUF1684 domain-containing protein [Terracidiphilus sp.]|jgi:uncharacterized protein (DUF1684 family)